MTLDLQPVESTLDLRPVETGLDLRPVEPEETETPTPPEAVSRPGAIGGTINEFKRGMLAGQQQIIAAELAAAPKQPSLRQLRRSFVQSMSDPEYQQRLSNAAMQDAISGGTAQQDRIEMMLGPTGRAEQLQEHLDANRTALAGQIADLEQEQQAVPRSQTMAEWGKANNANWWKVLAKNPVEIASGIMAQSLPAMAPAMAMNTLAPGGRIGHALATAAGSGMTEAANAYLDSARQAGYDFTDPDKVKEFFDNPKARDTARAFAAKRGLPIGLFDGLTAGLAGKFMEPALREGAGKILKATGTEVSMQAAGGMSGELAAQLASGQKVSLKDIAAEGIGEIASAPQEILSNLRQGRPARRAEEPIQTPGRPTEDELPPIPDVESPELSVESQPPSTLNPQPSTAPPSNKTERTRFAEENLAAMARLRAAKDRQADIEGAIEQVRQELLARNGELGTGNAENIPVRESPATLQAQAQLVSDGKTPAMLVTPGEAMPSNVDPRLQSVETPVGTFVFNPDQTSAEEIWQRAEDDSYGRLLGLSTARKPANGQAVLQTTDANGTPLKDEVVSPQTLPAAVAAAQGIVPEGGQVGLRTPEEVLEQRRDDEFAQWLSAGMPEEATAEEEAAETDQRRAELDAERPPDILDVLGDYYPKGIRFTGEDYAEHLRQYETLRKSLTKAERRLIEPRSGVPFMSDKTGEAADGALSGIQANGHYRRVESLEEMANAMLDAMEGRVAREREKNDIIARLRAAKRAGKGRSQMAILPGFDAASFDAIWNTAIDIAIGAVKAGRATADAIRAALEHLRKNAGNGFDETAALQQIGQALTVRGVNESNEAAPSSQKSSPPGGHLAEAKWIADPLSHKFVEGEPVRFNVFHGSPKSRIRKPDTRGDAENSQAAGLYVTVDRKVAESYKPEDLRAWRPARPEEVGFEQTQPGEWLVNLRGRNIGMTRHNNPSTESKWLDSVAREKVEFINRRNSHLKPRRQKQGNVYEWTVTLKKPVVGDAADWAASRGLDYGNMTPFDVREAMIKEGFDGQIDIKSGDKQVIVFFPESIIRRNSPSLAGGSSEREQSQSDNRFNPRSESPQSEGQNSPQNPNPVNPSLAEADLRDTVPIATKQYTSSSDGIDRFRIYRGESVAPSVVKVERTVFGDTSRVSKSRYPVVRVVLDNGATFLHKIRVSDHPQVSQFAPQMYDVDVRAVDNGTEKRWRELQPILARELEPLTKEIWREQMAMATGRDLAAEHRATVARQQAEREARPNESKWAENQAQIDHLENLLKQQPNNKQAAAKIEALRKANATLSSGVAGIKSSLDNSADKSNISALQKEEGSALTSQTKPQNPNPVNPSLADSPTYFHGTRNDYKDADIATGQKMFGIHLTTDEEVAKTYGTHSVKKFKLDSKTKTLDLSDGVDLWAFMQKHGIVDKDQAQDVDLENYTLGGRLFQYDLSSRTHLADDVARTAKELGYDLVKMPDDLGGRGENIAHVVVNPKILKPFESSRGENAAQNQTPILPATALAPLPPVAYTLRDTTDTARRKRELRGRGYPLDEAREFVAARYRTANYAGALYGKDNIYLVMPSTKGENPLANLLAERLQRDFGGQIIGQSGTALAETEAKRKVTFLAKAKDPTRFVARPGLAEQTRGRNVVVVDDILTSGETLTAFLNALNDAGIQSDHTAVLAAKNGGRKAARSDREGLTSLLARALKLDPSDVRREVNLAYPDVYATFITRAVENAKSHPQEVFATIRRHAAAVREHPRASGRLDEGGSPVGTGQPGNQGSLPSVEEQSLRRPGEADTQLRLLDNADLPPSAKTSADFQGRQPVDDLARRLADPVGDPIEARRNELARRALLRAQATQQAQDELTRSWPRREDGSVDVRKVTSAQWAQFQKLGQERDEFFRLFSDAANASGVSYATERNWLDTFYRPKVLSGKLDKIDEALTRWIAATSALNGNVLEGIGGAPVWMTKAALNGLLRVTRAAYRATRSLPQAIQAGLEWLRSQNIPGYSETDAKTFLERRLSVRAGDDDLNVREFLDQMDADQPIGADIGRRVANLLYDRRTNESDAAFAARIMAAVGGPQGAMEVFADATNGLPGSVRMMLGQLILKSLGDANQHEAAAKFYDDLFAGHVTDIAQSLQAMNAFLAMTPQGKLIWAQRKIARAAAELLAPNTPDIEAAQREMAQINQQGIDATTASPDVQTAARQAVDSALDQQAGTLGTELQQALRQQALDELVAAGLITQREAEILLLHLESPGDATFADKLASAGLADPVKRAKTILDAYKKRGEGNRAKVKDRAAKARKQPLDPGNETSVDAAIRRAMKDLRIRLSRLIRSHYSQADATGRTLAEKLVQELGLTGEAAERLAATVERRFSAIVSERKKKALEKLLKPVQKRGLAKPTLVQKIIEASNAGALSAEQFWNAVKKQLRLPEWSAELAERIRKQIDAIEQIPESQIERKQKAQIEMLNTLERAKGLDHYDLVMAFYITNILTGLTTHGKNVISTGLNTTVSLGLEGARAVITGHPDDLVLAWTAALEGARKGGRGALDVLRTGVVTGSRLQKLEPGRALEITKFGEKGGVPVSGRVTKAILENRLAKFLNAWKYNYRLMAAEDLLFFKPAEEAKTALLAKRIARSEGLRGEAAADRARQILGYGKQVVDAANAHASSEGLSGSAAKRRAAELLEQARPEDLREDARQFALRTTFNNEPYGALGFIAHLLNQAKTAKNRKIRVGANLIAPFTSIIANVVNESLNYSPIGAARAVFSRENLLGFSLENLSLQQRADLRAELYGKAALGTGLLVALALSAAGNLDDDDPNFAIYGMGPSDDVDRKGWFAKGGIANSFKIGDRYYSYVNTPLAAPLAWLGMIQDRQRDARLYNNRSAQRSMGNLLWSAAGAAVGMTKVFTDQSFLTGLMDVAEMVSENNPDIGSRQAVSQATRIVSSAVVPNLVRQVDRYFDPKLYERRDLQGIVINAIPFVRGQQGQPMLNALGMPVKSPLLRVFTSSQAETTPVVKFLAETGNWPSLPDRNHIWGAKGRTMTEEEFYNYVRDTGARIQSRLEKQLASLQRAKPETQSKRVAEIVSQERENWRKRNGWQSLLPKLSVR